MTVAEVDLGVCGVLIAACQLKKTLAQIPNLRPSCATQNPSRKLMLRLLMLLVFWWTNGLNIVIDLQQC